jgi:hypothetical protein
VFFRFLAACLVLSVAGEETVSPFNPYRLHTLEELNTEAGSNLDASVDFNGTTPQDLTLVNGQLVPTVNMVNKNPHIFKILNAGTGRPLRLTLPDAAVSCQGVVIAVDGVYLQARWVRSSIFIPAGGRVDLEVFCDFVGTYTVYESGQALFHARIGQSTSNRPPVKDAQLEAIRRPAHLDDLRVQNSSTIDRYYSVDLSPRPAEACSFQLGFGMNCLNETFVYNENASFPQFEYDCSYESWAGSRGLQPFDYVLSNRFITFVDALNQWTIIGGGTPYQSFSMRVNKFQIMSIESNQTAEDWFLVGQYRDTLPLVADRVIIRFISADYTGEHTFQSDFVRHQGRGARDSFLVVNYSSFQALTQLPTSSPTVTPDGESWMHLL